MSEKKDKIAVIGGGSWATALVKILLENHTYQVLWWMRDKEVLDNLKDYHHNHKYLPSLEIHLPKKNLLSDLKKTIKGADIIILAVPAAFLHDALKMLEPKHFEGKIVVSAIKGMIPDENLIIGEYLQKYFDLPLSQLAAITGPCHAEEVAQEKLSYLTIAGINSEVTKQVSLALNGRFIRTIQSEDILGTEYGAVMKNIFAIASGIALGLGYGDNFHAVLMTSAIREMETFLEVILPTFERDVKTSAYLGDLLVTAYSKHSRNRTFGTMIGRGYSPLSAQLEMNMVAEGYFAVKSIHQINLKYKTSLPITETVYKILYEGASPRKLMAHLAEKLD